jgi:hypothetical protein
VLQAREQVHYLWVGSRGRTVSRSRRSLLAAVSSTEHGAESQIDEPRGLPTIICKEMGDDRTGIPGRGYFCCSVEEGRIRCGLSRQAAQRGGESSSVTSGDPRETAYRRSMKFAPFGRRMRS